MKGPNYFKPDFSIINKLEFGRLMSLSEKACIHILKNEIKAISNLNAFI
jgi:hypothetical protein